MFDPLGLRIDVETTEEKETKPVLVGVNNTEKIYEDREISHKTTTINFTASLYKEKGVDVDLDDVKSRIENSLKEQFTGKSRDQWGNTHKFNINVDIQITDSAKNIREGDHSIVIANRVGRGEQAFFTPGQVNDIGANEMTLNARYFNSSQRMGGRQKFDFTAAGEFGHLAGLHHPNQMRGGEENPSFIKSVENSTSNFMNHDPNTSNGSNIHIDQISRMQELYNNTVKANESSEGMVGDRFQYINRNLP